MRRTDDSFNYEAHVGPVQTVEGSPFHRYNMKSIDTKHLSNILTSFCFFVTCIREGTCSSRAEMME